jgi:peptide/nickel transport system substrate-binding protein
VFTSSCEKLYDIDKNLNVVPQLAASMPTVSQDRKTVEVKLRQVRDDGSGPLITEATSTLPAP